MNKFGFTRNMKNVRPNAEYTIEEWNEAVKYHFGPYVRRKSILHHYRQQFRTELINLAKIQPYSQYTNLLSWLLKLYRSAIRKNPKSALAFLVDRLDDIVASDSRWMSLSTTRVPLPKETPLQDQVFRVFNELDTVLEGCFKLHLRIAYGFATGDASGTFPTNVQSIDFGNLVARWPVSITAQAALLLKDPEYGISISQWRNIAAHKNFRMKSSRTVGVEYGPASSRHTKTITFAGLKRTLHWSVLTLNTIRLCNTIIYLEYMRDLHSIGLPKPTIRLDALMMTLCHNINLVGFRCLSYSKPEPTFTINLTDEYERPLDEAIIHASQFLDQLCVAATNDLTYRKRVKRVSVQIFSRGGEKLATASAGVDTVLAFLDGKIKQKTYINQVDFALYSKV